MARFLERRFVTAKYAAEDALDLDAGGDLGKMGSQRASDREKSNMRVENTARDTVWLSPSAPPAHPLVRRSPATGSPAITRNMVSNRP